MIIDELNEVLNSHNSAGYYEHFEKPQNSQVIDHLQNSFWKLPCLLAHNKFEVLGASKWQYEWEWNNMKTHHYVYCQESDEACIGNINGLFLKDQYYDYSKVMWKWREYHPNADTVMEEWFHQALCPEVYRKKPEVLKYLVGIRESYYTNNKEPFIELLKDFDFYAKKLQKI